MVVVKERPFFGWKSDEGASCKISLREYVYLRNSVKSA